jgi:ATP-dependent RNA helicase DOB1
MSYLEITPDKFIGDFTTDLVNFELDDFQKFACSTIDKKENVFVTSHTGAGKTLCAEYAIKKALEEKVKVVYVSPIKALSNQKYHDFKEKYPNIGILTGDIKINPNAELIIITAEILRNALFTNEKNNNQNNNDLIDYHFNPELVKYVILDEIHYINDLERGKVWEEIIMMLPKTTTLVMLSATVDSPEKLASWIANYQQKKTILTGTKQRPVPLKYFIFHQNGLVPFYSTDKHNWSFDKWKDSEKLFDYNILHWINLSLEYLSNHNLLPCIYFILSKKDIDFFIPKIVGNFNTVEETKQVNKIWDDFMLKYRHQLGILDEFYQIKNLVERGIAYHHSGMVPQIKEIIEILYSKKLVKVLLATETFAVGINMPTKTTLFMKFGKYDNSGFRNLYYQEFNQMAGRAGRRGIDKFGNVILLPKFLLPEKELKEIIIGKPITLKSRLDLDYSYVLRYFNNSLNSEMSFLDYLVKQTENSYFQLENLNTIKTINMEIEELEKEKLNLTIDDVKLSQYQKLEENLNDESLSQNKRKKLENELINMEKTLPDIKKSLKIKNKISSLKSNLDNNSLMIQFNKIMEFLHEENFMENNLLKKMGVMASQINQINPLVLSYLINEKILDNISFSELVAFLSLFIEGNNEITWEDISEELDEKQNLLIEDLMETLDYYEEKDIKLNNELPFPFKSNYQIYFENYLGCYMWAEGKKWQEIKSYYPSYEGNFIKTILRIHQILRELVKVYQIMENNTMINVIEENQDKLIREMVILDSLYLT